MRLRRNEHAGKFFRKHGRGDLHANAEEKYASKAAAPWREELARLVAPPEDAGAAAGAGPGGATRPLQCLPI